MMLMIILSLLHILTVALAARQIGAWCVGRWIRFECRGEVPSPLNVGRGNPAPTALTFAAHTATGLLILSHVLFLLAILHQVTRFNLYLLWGALGAIAMYRLLRKGSDPRGVRPQQEKSGLPPFLLGSLAFLYLFWMTLCAALPATAVDELIYHLEIPKRLLYHGGMFQFRNNIYGSFPHLGEMFFMFGLGTAGEFAARLYHVLWGGLLGLALYGFARRFLSQGYAFLAAALFFSIPSVVLIQPTAYVDLTYTLFIFLALAGVLEFFGTAGRLPWVVFAGLMAGGAVSTKYTGFQVLILLAGVMLIAQWFRVSWGLTPKGSDPFKSSLSPFILLSIAVLIALPYLLRNWALTGWPLFPFHLPGFDLRPEMNWDRDRARLLVAWLAQFGTPLGRETVWHTLLAPFRVFVLARMNSIEYYDGLIGPVFLLIPFLWKRIFSVGARPASPAGGRAVPLLGIFALLFLYYWAFTTKQVRHLIPVLPILSFLVVYGLFTPLLSSPRAGGGRTKVGGQVLGVVLILYIAGCFFVGARQVWLKRPLDFWRGKESRESYLKRQVGNYPIYAKANEVLNAAGVREKKGTGIGFNRLPVPFFHEPVLYLINMKNYGYFLDLDFESDFVFERWRLDRLMDVGAGSPRPSALGAETTPLLEDYFRNLGVTHLLVDHGYLRSPELGLRPEDYQRFLAFLGGKAALLASQENYTLYRLT